MITSSSCNEMLMIIFKCFDILMCIVFRQESIAISGVMFCVCLKVDPDCFAELLNAKI